MRWRRHGSVYCLAPSTWDENLRAAHEAGHVWEAGEAGRDVPKASIERRGKRAGYVLTTPDALAELRAMVDDGRPLRELRRTAATEARIALGGHAAIEVYTSLPSLDVVAEEAVFNRDLDERAWDAELRRRDDDLRCALQAAAIAQPPEGVGAFVAKAYRKARASLRANRPRVDAIMDALLTWGTIEWRP